MTKIEQANLQRNAEWTKNALAHKDGQGKATVKDEVTFKSVAAKDENGQVIIPSNLDDGTGFRLHKGTPAFSNSRPKSMFTDALVINAMTGF